MNRKTINYLVLILLSSGIVYNYSCKTVQVEKPLRIALSSGSENYVNWVHRSDSTAEIVDFKGMEIDSALLLLSTCDAILFTGGEDVVPSYYGKSFDSARCETNPTRDSLEFSLIKESIRLQIPILGVCRGQQILNVAFGGTLIVDIPADHPGTVAHRCEDYLKCFHNVSILRPSLLSSIAGSDSGMVTTNHHQAIEKSAPGIRIVAWSNDSIAEAIEWTEPENKPFFLAVQWHPERMDTDNPLSMPLMNAFLKAAIKNKESEKKE